MPLLLHLIFPLFSFADVQIPKIPFPVFLREGFSSVLEFDEVPTKVVLGDTESFNVDRMENSIVIKTLEPYATANLFVYFRKSEPKLFVLTASEDAEPTFHRKFSEGTPVPQRTAPKGRSIRGLKLVRKPFDDKKDFLNVELVLSADSEYRLLPEWDKVRLISKNQNLKPKTLWSERQVVQKDSNTKIRLGFVRPNVGKNLEGVRIVIPLRGWRAPMTVSLGGSGR